MLSNKSFTELRGIAQSFGVDDIFKKDEKQLIQAIEMKQMDLAPKPKFEIPKPTYDARLMTKPPSRKTDREEIEELLKEHVRRGLHLKFDEERWYMSICKKNDEGTIRMPLRTVLHCANKVME